jgi:hypothetical protein
MSSPQPTDVYSIDTCSLIDWQVRYYPSDVFSSLVTAMGDLVVGGRMVAPELVKEEVGAVGGSAELITWVDGQKNLFVPTPEVLAEAQAIQGRFPGLQDPKAEYEEADAYVIALARLKTGGIVVTQETPASEKKNPKRTHFIPDVCREFGVPCINLLGMMRREGWRF